VDQIDRDLASLLSVEPSPEFRARVRARIATEPVPGSWYLQWRVVGAGVATVAVVIAMAMGRPSPIAIDRPALPAAAVVNSEPAPAPVPRIATTAHSRTPRAHEPEVLVAPGDLRGLRQLEAIVREGGAQFVFPDEHVSEIAQEPVKDIAIAPIAIAPIDVATNSEPVGNAEGE